MQKQARMVLAEMGVFKACTAQVNVYDVVSSV